MKFLACSMLVLAMAIACQQQRPIVDSEITGCPPAPPSATEASKLYVVEPIEFIPEALGKFHRPITTNSADAQQFFDQGIQLKYAFAVNESVSSFRKAQEADTTCAMCYWGEAWALGSYLNGHMRKNKAPLAFAAIQKAAALAGDYANDLEKQLIDAMSVRYIEEYKYDERRVQDSLFALAMQGVFESNPEDLDIGTVYAEALFLLEPRNGHRALEDPNVMRLHAVLEHVLDLDITHPGACHLYIHATESTPNPGLAKSCADYLGDAIPGASHINHMPSHTYNEMGLWGESVRANLQASHTDRLADEGRGFAIYPGHNLHMLLFAACYDGQGAIAMRAAKDMTKMDHGNTALEALTMIRFGRFDEMLELPRPDSRNAVFGAFWDWCYGYSKLKLGESDFAELYVRRVAETADTITTQYRWQPAGPILKELVAILEGEIAREAGQSGPALAKFREAVRIDDSLPYSEPEPLPFDARHWLGSLLLDQGRYTEAEQVFRKELSDHPHNGWSLHGLVEALKAQSKPYHIEQEDYESSWARADVWLERPIL
ncbi:MAG: hypothetical protein AAGA85_17660 [Bacteroidota bacterium]